MHSLRLQTLILFLMLFTPSLQRDLVYDTLTKITMGHGRRLHEPVRISCDGVNCSNSGNCDERDGTCTCKNGNGGMDCQLDPKQCADGQLNATGHCCLSGVFDGEGHCCWESSVSRATPWRLDHHGKCCDTELNGCGECGGVGFTDAYGSCCRGTLDAAGLCCVSGNLDECGVCDGHGESCITHVELAVASRSARTYTCLEEFLPTLIRSPISNMSIEIAPEMNDRHVRVEISGGAVHALSFKRQLIRSINSDEQNPCSVTHLLAIQKKSLCGNGICEIGEAMGIDASNECRQDCPFKITACKTMDIGSIVGLPRRPCSGNGICHFAQGGTCACLKGYTGAACDRCATGFFPYRGLCHPRQSLYTPLPSTPRSTFVEEKSLTNKQTSSSSSNTEMTLIIVFAVGIAVCFLTVFVFIALYSCPKRQAAKRRQEPQVEAQVEVTPSGSLLAMYLKQFHDFQKSPPWEGSLDKFRGTH